MTEVSVVIPTRGRPEAVVRAVASAAEQTHRDLEIIVIVDGPDAVTEAALARVDDGRLQIVVQPEPLGAAEARNVGVRLARGRYVAFLDDDDAWLPAKLERQLEAIASASHRWPIGACAIVVRRPGGDVAWRTRPPAPDEPMSDYLFVRRSLRQGEGTVGTSTIVAPRTLLLEVPFDRAVRRYQDADWLLRAAAAGGRLVFVDERLSIWTAPVAGASITGRHATDWRYAYQWIVDRRRLVTARAYAAFLLVRVAALAAAAGDRGAVPVLWREARRRGRPAAVDVVLFALRWVVPGDLRERLRHRLAGVRSGTGSA